MQDVHALGSIHKRKGPRYRRVDAEVKHVEKSPALSVDKNRCESAYLFRPLAPELGYLAKLRIFSCAIVISYLDSLLCLDFGAA